MEKSISDVERSAEYRVTITMRGYGSDADAADDFLEGFLRTHPEAGPVVSINNTEDTIAVLLAVDAASRQQARERVAEIWIAGCRESGLAIGEVIRTEVERVPDSEAVFA
jgi:hypothetical protein